MSQSCKNIHPLRRPGVNQAQRVLDALWPDFAKVDERDQADLILFAKNYAAQLSYYNRHNQEEGDWTPFMLMDVSVTLAAISRLDIQAYLSYVKKIYGQLAATEADQEAELKKYFKTIFDLCFSITSLLDHYYRSLPEDFEFREVVGNMVHSGLPEYFNRLSAYFEEAVSHGLIDPGGTFRFSDPPPHLILSQEFHSAGLSTIWTKAALPVFQADFNGSTAGLKIKNTCTHNLFTGITEQYLKLLARVVHAAPAYLGHTLSRFPAHSPHYALFLAFIKLFKQSQDSLNTFTGKHLDLYYRDVLKLEKKASEPDQVHLLFELAKTAGPGVLLEEGTVFKGGKDRDGKEIFYRLTERTVLGKGRVQALKNIFVSRDAEKLTRRISAGPIANSEDGQGAPIPHADQSWMPFGASGREAGRAGFAIASDYLYLREGNRLITFTFRVPPEQTVQTDAATLNSLFSIRLSAEKDWFEISPEARKTTVAADRKSFSVELTLDGGDPALAPWSAEVHGHAFEQALPIALFTLADGTAPEDLWDLRTASITLKVSVAGYKSLLIENDEGILDPAKPFDLFGSTPRKGAAFMLACPEFFMKARQPEGAVNASLSFTWDNYDVLKGLQETNPALELHYLEDARWKKVSAFSQPLFEMGSKYPLKSTTLSFQFPQLEVDIDFGPGNPYSPADKWGFLKLILTGEFGHADYAKRLAESIEVVSVTKDGNTTTSVEIGEVPEPYTPRVREISLNYEVSTRLEPAGAEKTFFHLMPFGQSALNAGAGASPHLLPQFPDEGSLFIGLDQLQTGQTFSLLFQVAEGTADPLATRQEVSWHYLDGDNLWRPFRKEDIADGTGGLLKSGIVKLNIPSEAADTATEMGEALHWIKVSAAQHTAGFPRLIAIRAQAAIARFYDYHGDGNQFKEPLPPGTISKLLLSNPAIKKVEQPGASFGGRTPEDDSSWYRRISERLRHKQRAISMWDYERLVLEAFPEIYKVKCISHAQINNELSPGHVLVVPVPDLHRKQAFDPMRPRVSLGLLEDIRKFLSDLASPHVELVVCNPVFEELQLEFNIQYRSEDIDFYTRELRTELEQFLAPWAFDRQRDLEFGARVTKSALINFIEERPYVDYLSCVKMYHIVDGKRSNDLEEAIAGSSRSVIVSVKADDPVYPHIINESVCTC